MRIFKEKQRFNQVWLIVLLIMSTIVPLAIILSIYIKDPTQFSVTELVLIISLLIFASGFIFLFKLTTRIDEHGIHYKFFPFHLKFKTIPWNSINKIEVRTYDAITEFGGWGLKGGVLWKKANGKAINVSGDIGIQLELKTGKKLLIGTQKESEAKAIIATYKSKTERLQDV